MMKLCTTLLALGAPAVLSQALTNNTDPATSILRKDNGTFGPPVEEVHYYYDQWPIGLAVSSTGRIFTCYTRGSYAYTLGIVVNKTTERAWPSTGTIQNLPASNLSTSWHGISFGSGNATALVSVQALHISPASANRPETLWVVDTGRPSVTNDAGETSMPYAQPGGPKIVAYNITANNDTAYQTYTFPSTVHYPDSYMNDIRVDLRANLSGTAGGGVAYIVDSSNEGRPGFIVLDLKTGESWRRLSQDPSVLRVQWNVPSYVGAPAYIYEKGMAVGTQREALDGIQLSPDGSRVFYSPLTSTTLYSVPAANLRIRDQEDARAELMAHANVSDHGQRGADANGFEGDSLGKVYQLMPTQNAIYYYDPSDYRTHAYVRDPRILWPDSAAIAEDGYIYYNINQLFYQAEWNNGTDSRLKPGAILRSKLPGNATKQMGLRDAPK